MVFVVMPVVRVYLSWCRWLIFDLFRCARVRVYRAATRIRACHRCDVDDAGLLHLKRNG